RVLLPVREGGGDAAAREHAREDLGAGRVQVRLAAVHPGRAAGEGEQFRQHAAKRAVDRDRAVGTTDGDVGVQAERVVAPGDITQRRLDDPVVGRVDDLLVLPARPGVRARRTEPVAHAFGDVDQGDPPPRHHVDRLRKALALAGLDLDLAADQLPGYRVLERRVVGGGG